MAKPDTRDASARVEPGMEDTSAFLRLRYPSIACRPVPRFNLIIPAHWVVTEFPNALFVMGSSNGEDGSPVEEYWSNVVVHHERVLHDVTLETLAQSTLEDLQADIPNAVIEEELIAELGEHTHFIREITVPGETPEASVTRIDSFMFGPVQDHPTLDLFRITWLHPKPAGDERKALYRDILSSLEFEAEPEE